MHVYQKKQVIHFYIVYYVTENSGSDKASCSRILIRHGIEKPIHTVGDKFEERLFRVYDSDNHVKMFGS